MHNERSLIGIANSTVSLKNMFIKTLGLIVLSPTQRAYPVRR
jgi:hypothetical protein